MKILFIHSTAGAGHMKAAEALYDAIKNDPNHQVQIVDALDYTSKWYKKVYRESYSYMISRVPFVWGFFFGILDVPALQFLYRFARRINNHLTGGKLEKFLIKEQFDCIFSTHFMPNEVAAALKRKGAINSKIICCVTDFDVHRIWIAEGISHYCVATFYTYQKILKLGVPGGSVSVTGIPVNKKFTEFNQDISSLKLKLGLEPELFTVLVATGSFGIGPIEEIIQSIEGPQIVVVCGHNKNLFNKLKEYKKANLKVFGLVDNMHELMAVSDAMVTKPGGLSISEALANDLPLIFFNAIPGQEENNVMVLKSYEVGVSCKNINEIVEAVKVLQSSRDYYLTIRKKAKAVAHPFAVKDILSLISK